MEILHYILDTEYIDQILESQKEKYDFMFCIDWESIFKQFENEFNYPNYRRTIQTFKKLSGKLKDIFDTKKYLIDFYEDEIWDMVIMINSYFYVENTFVIEKSKCDSFFLPSLRQNTNKTTKNPCYQYNTSEQLFIITKNLTPKILNEGNSFRVCLNSCTFAVSESSLPTINSSLNIEWPSIGNLIRPFPNILNVSCNAGDNPNVLLKINFYDDDSSEVHNPRPKKIMTYSIQCPNFTLKNFFTLIFMQNRANLCSQFFENINFTQKIRKQIFNYEKLSTSHLNIKKSYQFNPSFEILWNEFKDFRYELDEGIILAQILFDKVKYIIESLELVLNSFSNKSAFRSFHGNLFLRPKKSLINKLIIRNLNKIIIKVAKEENIQINSQNLIEFSISPLPSIDHYILSERNIVSVLSDFIIKSDISKNLYPDILITIKALMKIFRS